MPMSPPTTVPAESGDISSQGPDTQPSLTRTGSVSEQSDNSQTAADFIRDQMQMEADAREAMPYRIETCTNILGPLRQSVFSCLTCNPPPQDASAAYEAAGVCYACSIQCHGDHTLVEIFNKRNFTCDCGTSRMPATSPCNLRVDPKTGLKGVHSEAPFSGGHRNLYNQNFRNRFCSCQCDYDPFQQKGTMFQCLGLGTHLTGGCGEDWYHPGCLAGLGPDWFEHSKETKAEGDKDNDPANDEDPPMPPGFPDEESFEGFICYKCVGAHPWIRQYAGASGFLPPLVRGDVTQGSSGQRETNKVDATLDNGYSAVTVDASSASSKKRKADDDNEPVEAKRSRVTEEANTNSTGDNEVSSRPEAPSDNTTDPAADLADVKPEPAEELEKKCKIKHLPPPPSVPFSLFFKEDFRERFCRCPDCYQNLNEHPQLMEEEETYEPSLSDGSQQGGSTQGSGSLYERGESALRNVDRVRAIEGVMAYNMMKDKLKPFFEQFAGTGRAISADDIKDYFAKLRGDDQAIRRAGQAAASSSNGDGGDSDNRREQSGY